MEEWLAIVPEEDRQLFASARFSAAQRWGERPALLVIDCTYAFTGTRPLPVAEAIAEFQTSCGAAAWDALPRIHTLQELFRSRGWPVVHTRQDLEGVRYCGRATTASDPLPAIGNQYPPVVAPRPDEWTLEKVKPSAFFGTPLTTYLQRNRIDTLVVVGCSTSGCVRATVVDGASSGFTVFVVADCCFDRSRFAHLANLFDISQKYGEVLRLEALQDRIAVNQP